MSQLSRPENQAVGVFPKKVAYFALSSSFLLMVWILVILFQNIDEFRRIDAEEIPALEASAISLRLSEKLHYEFELLTQNELGKELNIHLQRTNEIVSELEKNNSLLFIILLKQKRIIRTYALDESYKKYKNRYQEILNALESQNFDLAKKRFISDNYIKGYANYLSKAKGVVEAFSISRKESLEQFRKRLFIVSIAAIFAFLFTIISWIAVYRSYTRNLDVKRKLEDDLENQRLINFNSAKLASLGEMSAGIAHEINNPLTIITGSATRLKMRLKKLDLEDEKLELYLDTINSTIFRIASIVKSMKTLSRDGEGDEFVFLDIEELVKDALVLVSEKIKQARVDLSVDIDISAKGIMGRATDLSQVLINLVGNAVDALGASDQVEKRVEVSAKKVGEKIHLIVTDNGEGIQEEMVEKIFDPFFTTKDVGEGTGLGLSLSKKIVEQHQGDIFIKQKRGEISFIVELPIPQKFELKSAA